jgi:hypothetical protein
MGLKAPYRTIYEFDYDKNDINEALIDFVNVEGLNNTQKLKDFSLTTNQAKDTLFLTGGSTRHINYRIKFDLVRDYHNPALTKMIITEQA